MNEPGSGKTLFVLVNEMKIRNDLAQGGGAFLDTLVEFYSLNQNQEAAAKAAILDRKADLLKIEKAMDLETAIHSIASQSSVAVL